MGPAAWVWCRDTLLNEMQTKLSKEGVETVAYADDPVY